MKRFRFDYSDDLAELMFRIGARWYFTRDGWSDQFKLDGDESLLFVTEVDETVSDQPEDTYVHTIIEIVLTENVKWLNNEVYSRYGGKS